MTFVEALVFNDVPQIMGFYTLIFFFLFKKICCKKNRNLHYFFISIVRPNAPMGEGDKWEKWNEVNYERPHIVQHTCPVCL